jgi:acyl-CoA thioester hydrolase
MRSKMSYFEEGKFEGTTHIYKTRICFHHTDAGRIVYHSRYLDIAEEARGAFLRLVDCEGSGIIEENGKQMAFALRRSEIDYLRPAKLLDIVEVRSKIAELKKASITILQEFFVGEVKMTSIKVRLACVDINTGRPQGIPKRITEKLESYI